VPVQLLNQVNYIRKAYMQFKDLKALLFHHLAISLPLHPSLQRALQAPSQRTILKQRNILIQMRLVAAMVICLLFL
jgi:hypothetical protein